MISTAPRVQHERAQGFDRRKVEQLLAQTRRVDSLEQRIEILSRHFLGFPYTENPLVGSACTTEVFTASLEGFDCVTYIETVLALARASDAHGFVDGLRKVRYAQGRIQWARRNHYMTDWISNNIRNRVISPITHADAPTVSIERILNTVPGLPSHRARIKCIPKPRVPRLEPHAQTGDLIFFASTKKHLDVFHAGIIVRDGKTILMRHASRSRGGVIEQPLSEFLKANRMSGVLVVRPRAAVRP